MHPGLGVVWFRLLDQKKKRHLARKKKENVDLSIWHFHIWPENWQTWAKCGFRLVWGKYYRKHQLFSHNSRDVLQLVLQRFPGNLQETCSITIRTSQLTSATTHSSRLQRADKRWPSTANRTWRPATETLKTVDLEMRHWKCGNATWVEVPCHWCSRCSKTFIITFWQPPRLGCWWEVVRRSKRRGRRRTSTPDIVEMGASWIVMGDQSQLISVHWT